jgi:hypothetical protein
MIEISVQADVKAATRWLSDLQKKQVPFATSVAINSTAKAIEDEQRREISGTFDRPKPTTIKATYVKRSTKTSLSATVGLKDRQMGVPAAEYLHPNVTGGTRTYKRSELMLHRAGILPAGMFTVPGAGAKIDAYGNMSRGQINQILSYFRTFGNTGLNTKRMNMTDKRRASLSKKRADYFIVPVAGDGLFPGVWQRTGKDTIAPVLLFVSKAAYRATYNFGEIADKVVRRTFQGEFAKALDMALRTAR